MDLNVRGLRTVQAALAEPVEPDKRKVAGRKGGLLGGPARTRSVSAKRRIVIALQASAVRWKKSTPK
jgi:hypothetical protein